MSNREENRSNMWYGWFRWLVKIVGNRVRNKLTKWNLVPFTVARLAVDLRSQDNTALIIWRCFNHPSAASVSFLRIELRKNSTQLNPALSDSNYGFERLKNIK